MEKMELVGFIAYLRGTTFVGIKRLLDDLRVTAAQCEIDRTVGGKLRDKNAEKSWEIIENLALYDHEGWNDPRDFAKPVKAISLPQNTPKTPDRRLLELEDQIGYLLKGSRMTLKTSSTHIPQAYDEEISSNPHSQNLDEPPRQNSFTFKKRTHSDPQHQTLKPSFEARVQGYMAAHTERIERFKKAIFKQREEINDRMSEMFGLLKELTTSRTPEKKEKSVKNNEVVDKNVVEPSELDVVEPIELVDRKEGMEDGTNDESDESMKEKLTEWETKAKVLVEMPRLYLIKRSSEVLWISRGRFLDDDLAGNECYFLVSHIVINHYTPERKRESKHLCEDLLAHMYLDSPCLLVLITGTSQSRQHDKSESVKSCKSPTAVSFDVDTGRIAIVTVNTKEYHSDVLARSQG
ncbi:hypothetical protein Tco_1320911 [Tanacetum coccineum]